MYVVKSGSNKVLALVCMCVVGLVLAGLAGTQAHFGSEDKFVSFAATRAKGGEPLFAHVGKASAAMAFGTVSATATVNVIPATVPLGQSFSFDVQFANTGGVTGYNPYVNLLMPSSGVDGNDGYSFVSATYLGQTLTPTILACPSGSSVISPLTGLSVSCPATPSGQPSQLVILQPPFGSVTPAQMLAPIVVSAAMSNLADVGVNLPISAAAGFVYGDSPTGSMPSEGTRSTDNVAPSLLTVAKQYLGLEQETATGPNYPRSFTLTPNLPAGQTATNVMVTDTLPSNIVYTGATVPSGATIVTQPPLNAVVTAPNNVLKVTYASLTGAGAATTVNFYVPQNNASGTPIVNPLSGAAGTTSNQATAMGTWTPLDPRDGGAQTINGTSDTINITDRSVAIQKTVSNAAPPVSPGDILTYRLNFQLSDYFSARNLVITDVLSDGQDYVAGSASLNVTDRNGNVVGTIPASAITVTNNSPSAGQTTVRFDVSAAMIALGAADGTLQGGRAILPNAVAAGGFITFNANVRDTYQAAPMGPILPGDDIRNQTSISADIVANNNITGPATGTVTDNSSTLLEFSRPALAKSVYAINGNTTLPNPLRIAPGDAVTFRLTYTLSSGDYQNFTLLDTLPLPSYKAETLTDLSFNNTNTGVPAVGEAQFGPLNSGAPRVTVPAITVSASTANNQITFNFGNNSDPTNTPTTVDVLFTLPVQDDPFTDPLLLTNQANSSTTSSNGTTVGSATVTPVVVTGPKLRLRKGVVAVNNAAGVLTPSPALPAGVTVAPLSACGARLSGAITSSNLGTTFDANLTNVDAGDQVTYAIIVENTGSGIRRAFDVAINETIPAGTTLVPGSICVNNGAGAAIPFTGALPGTLTLTDPSATQGALAQGVDALGTVNATGSNIGIITFTVTLTSSVTPRQNIDNTATLTNYAAIEGGDSFVPLTAAADRTNDARITIRDPQIAKMLVGTEINNAAPNPNGAAQAVIGEFVTYSVTYTVPEGTSSGVSVVDTLDAGLAFVDVVSLTTSAGVTHNAITTGAAPTNTTITGSGQTINFNLGTVTNINTDNTVAETVTLTYRAVVLNVAANQAAQTRANSAVLNFNGTSLAAVRANPITIIEPQINTAKTVSINGGTAATTNNADAGDTVRYTITLTQPANSPDAFEVTLNDPIPAAITGATLTSVTDSAGVFTTANFSLVGNTLSTVTPIDIPAAATTRTITLVVTGTLASSVMPGDTFNNVATTQWTSLDGTPGTRSTYNTNATERTGTGGVNDYVSTGTATITVFPVAPSKSLVTTSEAHTSGVSLAIGEIARYRLRVRLPEGAATNFQFRDNLPAGLQFLNDGTARFAFVTNNTSGITSTTLTAATTGCTGTGGAPALVLLGDDTTINSLTPACTLPDTAVSANTTTNDDAYASGTDIFFKFGDLLNSDSDTNLEYLLVEFNAILLNETGNTRGITRSNNFTALNNGVNVGTSGSVTSTIQEPLFTLAKSAAPVSGDAGDVIKYTVTYTNSGANTTTAFDARLLDTLPTFLTLIPSSVMATAAGGASSATNNSSGNLVDVSVASIPVGGSITLMYQATLNANVPAGQIVPNTATLTYSSLPGTNGTTVNATGSATPGAPGTATGERTGTGGINSYTLSASASVSVTTPTIVKLTPTPTTYAIGETVTYNIRVILPEGDTRNLVVLDDLPTGMSYVSHAVITSAAASGGLLTNDFNGTLAAPTLTPAAPVDGDVLNFALGTPNTAADNDPTTNQFLVRVVARVNNVAGNVNGTNLTNTASLTYTNPNTSATVSSATSSATVRVTEPRLQVVKTASTNTPKCGDRVTYTIVVSHAGASTDDAFDVTLRDAIPTGLTYVAGSLTLVAGTPAPSPLSEAGGTISADWASFPLNSTVTLRYQVDVPECPPGTINQSFTNTANLAWTSLAGTDANERTGAGGVNSYSTSDNETITITQPSILSAKINNPTNTTTLMPGDMVTYTITIQNTGNAPATSVTFSDAIPANTTYVAGSTTLNGSAVADVSGAMPFATSGAVNTPGEPSGTVNNGETATVVFKVMVNNPLPLGVTQISNQGTARGTNIPDTPTNIVTNPVTGTPRLALTKTYNNLTRGNLVPAQSGDIIEYTVRTENIGNLPATSVTLTDAIPANTTYVASSTTLNGAAVADSGGTMPYVTATAINSPGAPSGQLNVGAANAALVKFNVTVNAVLMPASTSQLVNTATANGNGPGGALTPATGTVNTPLNANPVLGAAKSVANLTNSSGTAQPGDTLEYTIVITNTGNIASTGTTFTDAIPAHTTYVPNSTTLNGAAIADVSGAMPYATSGAINSPSAASGVFNVGSLNQATVKFRVTLNNPIALGVTQIVNQGSVSGNGPTAPVGPTPSNQVVTPVNANPVLGAAKAVRNLTRPSGTAQPGDVLEYTIVVSNTGDVASTTTTFTDTIPAHTTYVANSTSLNGAAAANMPGPIAINSPGAPSGQLDVGTGNTATITFRVTINNPLPSTILEIVNQGSVSGNGPMGPVGPTPTNQVTTPVGTNPVLDPLKSMVNLTRTSGTAMPGDVLEYTILVTNTGNTNSTNTTFSDAIPANTTYVANSTTLNGAAASNMPGPIVINSPSAASGVLNVGAANAATIKFRVTINNPLPANVTEVRNQGTVNGNGQGGAPLTPLPTNEVITPLNANPVLGITKTVQNLSRTSGTAQPGDMLEYCVTVNNTGNVTATGATLTDAIPAYTTYVLASTQLNGAPVPDAGGSMPYATSSAVSSPGEPSGYLLVGLVNAAIVKFRVTINSPLPPNITQVVNGATTNAQGPTGNPVGPVASPDVITPLGANPVLAANKSVTNLTRSSGTAQPGDILEYRITLENTGNIAATGVTFTDAIPAHTSYVASSTTLNGAATSDLPGPIAINSPGAPSGQLNAGANQCAVVTFRVRIDSVIPAGVTIVSNQGTVNGNGPTGNSVGPVPTNQVVSPLLTNPILEPTKSVANLTRSNGTAQPGDTLEYTITLTNTGNTPAVNTFLSDPIPAHTTYVAGSTMLNGTAAASITPGPLTVNSPGAPAGELRVGVANRAVVTFRVTIDDPLPPNVTTVTNVVTANGEGPGGTPVGPVSPPPVITPVGANPLLNTAKQVANLTRTSGTAQPGDVLEYTVTVTNSGNIAATSASLSDAIPANTTYVANSTTVNGVAATNITAGAVTIQSPGAPSGQLNVGSAQAATVRFRVTIDNPLPPNVTQVANQAFANANGQNNTPVGPVPSNEVLTPVGATPVLALTKTAVNLTRSSDTARPGDVLEYTIVTVNNGNIAATNATISDTLPSNTTYVAGSTTLNGAATANLYPGPLAINSPGAPSGQLNVGSAQAATVKFRVTINNPLPANTTQISNTASANANGPGGPVTPAQDSAIVPVQGNPALAADKSVINLTRSSGTAQPGDILEYTLTLTNTGDIPSTGTTLLDPIPLNTTYVAGSTTLNGAVAGNVPGPIQVGTLGAPSGQLNVGAVNAAVVQFRVRIDNPLPPSVLEILNQASLRGNSPQGPVGPVDSNPVATPVGSNPVLEPVKSVANLSRSSGTAQPGDVLEYTIRITNTGNTAATEASFTDAIPANTTYVAASTRMNGVAASDMPGPLTVQSPGAPVGEIRVGSGNLVTITFRVTVNNPLPPNITQVVNQGSVSANGQGGAPLTPVPTNEVITPLGANPLLSPVKSVVNLTRSAGTAQPGDVLEYTVIVTNTGNIAATNVTLTDPLPAHTTYVAGSTTLNGVAEADSAGAPVMMPYEMAHLINTNGAPSGQLNVGAANAAVVKFRVTINNPLPPNITTLENNALANANGPTGNPVGPVPAPPVITPLNANPLLNPTKTVANLTRTGTAQAGDVLEYTVRIENNGNIAATAATLTDAIPPNTTYVPASTTLNGTSVADAAGNMPYALTAPINSVGAPSGQLNVGPTQAAVVRFRVTINNPLPLGVTTVTNQATANANGPTGAPVGPVNTPPVVTPVATNPALEPVKTVANLTRTSGTAQPGDVLEYLITITNTGTTPATGASIFDSVPANTTYVAGSTTLNSATAPDIISGPLTINSYGAPAGQLNVGVANAAVVSFRVRINNPLPPNVTTVTNVVTANGNGPSGPVGPVAAPPVITPLNANPQFVPTKTVINLTRATGAAEPGDTLEYTVRIENTGNIAATAASLSDGIPANTSYVTGSTTLNGLAVGDIATAQMPFAIGGLINSPGVASGLLNVGAAQSAIVKFRVTINNPLPPDIRQVTNVATANGNGPTGNPAGPVVTPPVNTPINAAPVLGAVKSVVDLNGNPAAPGDQLEYTIIVTNTGNLGASNTTITDAIPANTAYVAGSTTVNGVAAANLPGPVTIQSPGAAAGQLLAGAANAAVVRFRVQILNPLPAGARNVSNTAVINANGQTGALPPVNSNMVTTPLDADLTITKTHTGTTFQAGQTGTFTLTVRNLGPAPTSSMYTVTDTLPAGLRYLSATGTGWTCNAVGQVVTCTSNQTLNLNQSAPPITLAVGVMDGASSSLVNTATVSSPDDLNPANNTASDPFTVGSGFGGTGSGFPGAAAASDQKPGSLLIFPVFTSDPTSPARENTRFTLTNYDERRPVSVHLFYVDGATCSIADAYLCLTPNQTASFLASDLDPGTTGYLLALAVDELGCPISFNRLGGEAWVKWASGHQGSYGAESYGAQFEGRLPTCDATSTTAEINLDGVQYNAASRVLALSGLASPADGNNTLLVLTRTGGNLATGTHSLGTLFGLLYDDAETPYSFGISSSVCQLRQSLADSFPRTTPRLSQVVSTGRSGWLKLYGGERVGLAGIAFNRQRETATVNHAFQGAHNLHTLRLGTDQYTVPIFPPRCR